MRKIVAILSLIVLVAIATTFYFAFLRQPAEKENFVVGIVSYGGAHEEAIEGLKDGMTELGYEEGKDISYIIVNAEGSLDKVREAAVGFLEAGADAVYSITTPITQEVMKSVSDRPVVFNIVGDPVGAGIAQSWQSSGNNSTGCSNYVGQTGPKRLEILKTVLPEVKNVLVLYDPNNRFSQDAIEILRPAAEALDITVSEVHISSKEEIISALSQIKPGQYDAFFHLGEAKVSGAAEQVVRLVNEAKLPSIAHEESFAERGMLLTFGPSWHLLGVQCAGVMDKVLKNTLPAEIPIQIPERLDLVLNLRTAELLNIEISKEALLLADRIIE